GQLGLDFGIGLVERREPGLRRQRPARQLGLGVPGPDQAFLGGTERRHGTALGRERRFALGPSLSRSCRGAGGGSGGERYFPGENREPVALAKPLRGRIRIRFEPDEPVPSPQPAVTVDKTLARFELRLQPPPGRLVLDPAGP